MNGQDKQSARAAQLAQVSAQIPAGKKADEHFSDALGATVEIRNVWADNLEDEMENIMRVIQEYPFVAMDTEFPGVVARPVGDYTTTTDYQYQTLRCNVDLLKIIQLGLTFTDAEGNMAEPCACWQFNFKFSLSEDMYAQDSIEMLKTSGIDFEMHERRGIDVQTFGELMTMSGLVLTDDVRWISFHSSYDFGYLVKLLTCQELPTDETLFMELLHTFFPAVYDIKYMITACDGMFGGLNAIADQLQVERIGPMHQAGSDSMLTAQTFFKLVERHLGGLTNIDDSRFRGELFGLGSNHTKYKGGRHMSNHVHAGNASQTVSHQQSGHQIGGFMHQIDEPVLVQEAYS